MTRMMGKMARSIFRRIRLLSSGVTTTKCPASLSIWAALSRPPLCASLNATASMVSVFISASLWSVDDAISKVDSWDLLFMSKASACLPGSRSLENRCDRIVQERRVACCTSEPSRTSYSSAAPSDTFLNPESDSVEVQPIRRRRTGGCGDSAFWRATTRFTEKTASRCAANDRS